MTCIMKKILFLIIVAASVFTACKKTEDLGVSRLFRPVVAGQLSADSNTIVAAWQKSSGATSYIFQISRDTFRTIDRTLAVDTNAVVVKGLLYNQLYQLQVKAVAKDTVLNSRWSYLGEIKTLSSILQVPATDDITFNAVRVRWTTKGSPVNSIRIIKTSDSSQVSVTTLTAADRTNEYKIIGGLTASTKYTIFLLSGTDVRGSVDFTTKPPIPGNIIDLTGITGRPAVLADTIPVVPSGSTILLKRGETYNIASGINLNKSLVFRSGPDLSVFTQAAIYFTSNFNFTAGATIDSIEFNDVYMYSDNYASRYVFNTTGAATVGKLKFLNSKAEIFRGLVRLQSGATTVSNFIINNCIMDSLSNYGVITVDNVTCKAENISITNSTFYKVEKVVTSRQNSTSVLIENCTFNETPLGGGSNYYIDYNTSSTSTVTNGITVNNCIFGIGKPNAGSAGSTTVRDVRASAATTINANNNFRTSDHLSSGNDFPNITTHSRPSSQLWQNPTAGDFKIIDNLFSGRSNSGDPRWRL